MNNIVITDNKEEMIKIGKELMESKPNIYTKQICDDIMKVIDANMPEATDAEKQNMMYRSIYDYWVYGFNISEEFYHRLENKTHEEKSTYVSNRNRLMYIEHLNKKEDAYILDDKYEAYKKFKPYYRREIIKIDSQDDFEVFSAFVDRHPVFVAKPTALWLGLGVHKVDVSKYNDKRVLFEELLKEGTEMKKLRRSGTIDGTVLEEVIEQAEELEKIHPQSINGVRLTTVRVGDKVHMCYPWFKIGAGGQFVASAAIGTMDACIDVKTGIVETPGCKENGERLEYHPQTGIKIPGYVIPRWDELLEMAKDIAMQLDTINYVGWDFALTPDGWCIMEGNFAGEFMWQMCYDKGMKKEFEELIGWKPETDFWWQKA